MAEPAKSSGMGGGKEEEEEAAKQAQRKDEEEAEEEDEEEEESEEEEEEAIEDEELWNFPVDEEGWKEEDLGEHWAEHWGDTTTVGYDPEMVDPEDMDEMKRLRKLGKGPPNTPYYVPYRKYYPSIPDNHADVETPEDVVEELDRMEEFFKWVSYVFKDGSSYEGTVWDDLAHGRGVYTTPLELCRYEGQWFQNMMQGYGVLEVDLPVAEPPPDSKEAEKMKKQGAILKSDYMDSFDKEWLKKDIEDYTEQFGDYDPVPFEDDPVWIKRFGALPEKGHYKYSGQWKHNRMHGCGVYEINGRPIWGKFYFGELLPEPRECTFEQATLHSSLAEVAAAKARMFVNKPDGMVRELRGPYSDPQHPYMYEEDDVWMAPGFVNAYHEVPDRWKLYVEDVDKEREMWLNSFIKSPLRIGSVPELEYFWSRDDEFVLLENRPTSSLQYNPENVAKAEEGLEGEVLLHVPTGNIINWITDKDGIVRMFWQPFSKDGVVRPELAIPLPLGIDEFMKQPEAGDADEKQQSFWGKLKKKWKESAKEVEEMKQQKLEQQLRKWQEEDLAGEKQMKLKDAEKKLTQKIQEAEFDAKYRDLYEELLERESLSKVSGDQMDEDKDSFKKIQGYEELADDEKTVPEISKEEKDEGKEEEEEDKEKEKEEEEEEDKKPRSFGRVARVDSSVEENKVDTTNQESQQNTSAPFASLSFASHLIVKGGLSSQICQVAKNLLSNRLQSQPIANLNFTHHISQCEQTRHLSMSVCKRDLRLRAAFPKSKWHVTRNICPRRKTIERLCRKKIVITNHDNNTTETTPDCTLENVIVRGQFESNGPWFEPKHSFLSIAFPL